jgi:RHH-type transcriptional regulator, proline utilization regulon repressor / proline dehydrogenase / delta 1-pyrroline-5-carboxylate dehydrogenase
VSNRASERGAIERFWRAPEPECVPALVAAAQLDDEQRERVASRARRLIEAMRHHGGADGVEALTRAFPLNSSAGLALLSLAEALLRVPDSANANRLLRDRLSRIDWSQQPKGGRFAGALRLASRMVSDSSLIAPIATPVVRLVAQIAIRALSAQFVFAEDIDSALRRSHREPFNSFRYSFDMLGEAAMNDHDAQRYLQAYERAIHAIGRADRGRGPVAGGSVSVKLSAIHPRYSYAQQGRAMQELLPRLLSLARLARQYNIALAIDAEESERLDLSLDLIECVMAQPDLSEWSGFGVVVQAYQKRAPAVIEYLLRLASRRPARLMVRLVKGAYWDAEIKLAQMEGMSDFPVYTRKVYTDVAYLACARGLLRARDRVMPQFATHNAQTVAAILELAKGAHPDDFEFQCLYGMGAGLYQELMQTPEFARPVRVYAPVGTRPTLLAYLMRRLLENGAAASFVQRAASSEPSMDELIADPTERASALNGEPHPQIEPPRAIFGARLNSSGVDLSDTTQQAMLLDAIDHSRAASLQISPLIAATGAASAAARPRREIRNPADRRELIGHVADATPQDLAAALIAARAAAAGWGATDIESRAQMLEHAADLFERELPALVALAVRESGKTLANAVGEVREAVDYLRYYPVRIRDDFRRSTPVPLGVVACISPWNFPLAIFTGQVAAALAAGNCVLAKPAEQSSAMGARAVQLLHQAGVPPAVLQLLPGDGEKIGAALVADARIDGVVFTGSTAAARSIARTLAQRGDVPLIAETGGQNAMIVDSTALPEQVVADVVRSAFDSAGQRCSALRVLCLQQEIADATLAMLEGAMRELRVGDPAQIATDVGPLIDEEAHSRIDAYLRAMRASIRTQTAVPEGCGNGVFVPPTLIEIKSLAQLTGEVFGPVLHVLRFERRDLPALIDAINTTGYGLTLGIASRIESTITQIVGHVSVGNIYVNRNVIGAVVGLQPFGGHGLSGTGPKAGGPLYLHRLLKNSTGYIWQDGQPGQRGSAPPGLRRLQDWLGRGDDALISADERAALAQQALRYAHSTLYGARIPLKGYVGESDELRLRSRGVVRATAKSAGALLAQLAAALATGNTLSVDQPELAAKLGAALPAALRRALKGRSHRYDAVLVDAQDARLHPQWVQTLFREVAALDGAIVPVIVSQNGYALERLLLEQTVTVNTAAVGGDVRLLALDDV